VHGARHRLWEWQGWYTSCRFRNSSDAQPSRVEHENRQNLCQGQPTKPVRVNRQNLSGSTDKTCQGQPTKPVRVNRQNLSGSTDNRVEHENRQNLCQSRPQWLLDQARTEAFYEGHKRDIVQLASLAFCLCRAEGTKNVWEQPQLLQLPLLCRAYTTQRAWHSFQLGTLLDTSGSWYLICLSHLFVPFVCPVGGGPLNAYPFGSV